jgi:addiction module HigA family antidote
MLNSAYRARHVEGLSGIDHMRKKRAAVHPGEVLREDFLEPMNLSAYVVACACGVPRTRIERLVREETPVTADTALRLAKYFGTTAAFWMGMQAQYDLERTKDEVSAEIKRIQPVKSGVADHSYFVTMRSANTYTTP